jgi:hypothetical protein
MIAVDTNVLVYAHREDSTWHSVAEPLITTLAEGRSSWAIPWPSVHEFISIVTNARIYRPASSLDQALGQVDAWLTAPNVQALNEAPGYYSCLTRTARQGRCTGAQIHDARIAAICIHHGVSELWTADRDFSRFPELKVRNPLVS